MVYLALIYHMHQPYYKNLLTQGADVPWVRLHGTKDYLDMPMLLEKYPHLRATFNVVPSLLEQIEDYANNTVKDKFLELSRKSADHLSQDDKKFMLERFFSTNRDKVISLFPRYLELYWKREDKKPFEAQDFLDLQVWFNLAWIDPHFRRSMPELKRLVGKGRFYSEADKRLVIDKQLEILAKIIPYYRSAMERGQIEVSLTPYYHPIMPLLYDTSIAKEADLKTALPKQQFSYPQDLAAQVDSAVSFYRERFGVAPAGMWPSEEGVSEHILTYIMKAGFKWIVTDEAILFRSLKRKKRNTRLLYQPHLLKRKDGELGIVFRDRNLSDIIGFMYQAWKPQDAAADFVKHLENISNAFKDNDVLVTIAMDGENAWEYFTDDGYPFLEEFYKRISEARFVKTTTINDYIQKFRPALRIPRLAAGSWIYGKFGKWIGNPHKLKAWEWLAQARKDLQTAVDSGHLKQEQLRLAWKQIYILEGSDWFWWYGEDPTADFDKLYRMHMSNLYSLIGKEAPAYLSSPLTP